MVVERLTQKEDFCVSLKLNKHKPRCCWERIKALVVQETHALLSLWSSLLSLEVVSSSIVVVPVSLCIWRITSFKTAQKLQKVDKKTSKKSLLKAQDTQDYELRPSASNAKHFRHAFSFAKKYWKKTEIKKRSIRISALNYRITDKEKNHPWRILKNFFWDLFK